MQIIFTFGNTAVPALYFPKYTYLADWYIFLLIQEKSKIGIHFNVIIIIYIQTSNNYTLIVFQIQQ